MISADNVQTVYSQYFVAMMKQRNVLVCLGLRSIAEIVNITELHDSIDLTENTWHGQ